MAVLSRMRQVLMSRFFLGKIYIFLGGGCQGEKG